MSSSKPKGKSSVNEQVKAGLAALKDFLGGHTDEEAVPEERPPTADRRLDDPKLTRERKEPEPATGPRALGTSDEQDTSGDRMKPNLNGTHKSTFDEEEAALRDSVRRNSRPEESQTTDSRSSKHAAKGQVNTETDDRGSKTDDNQTQRATSDAETKPDDSKTQSPAPNPDPANPESSKAEDQHATPDEQSTLDQVSFEEAVETLRAAGPSAGRVAAARAIASLGSQRATPHLIAAMFDDDQDVRSAAEEALAQIGEPTFKQPATPQDETEKSKMMQPPPNAQQQTSVAPPAKSVVQPPRKEETHAQRKQETHAAKQPSSPAAEVVQTGTTKATPSSDSEVKPASEGELQRRSEKPHKGAKHDAGAVLHKTEAAVHKLKAVTGKAEVLDPNATEEEQQLLLEERAMRQRLELIVQQLSEKVAARKESENEVHWRLERESKLLADAAAQRVKEEKLRKKAEEEAAQRRKQEAEAIAAEQTARAKAEDEAERLATVEVRLRNEIAKLNQTAEELEQRRTAAEHARLSAAAAARQTEAQRARDEAERMNKAELERLRNDQAMLQAATEKAATRRAEVDAARERSEKDAEALALAQARMRDAEDARTKAEAERVKVEAELHLKVETEEAMLAAAKQRAQEEQARLEEEARRHRESEEQRLAAFEASRKKAEHEAKERAEREQQIRSQLDTLRIADAEVRKRTEEAEVRRRAAEEAFRLVAEKVQRVEAEAHTSKLEEEQILAKLEAARRNAAVEAQARAEQERRIKEEIEMFRRLEDEERPRLEELILQRSEAETRLQQQRERFKSEEEARMRAEEQIESLRVYSRPVVEPEVHQYVDDTVDIAQPELVPGEAPSEATPFASVGMAAEHEAAAVDADIPVVLDIPPAISSYLHSVDPYKRAAAVAELARSQAKDAFALIARCFDDHSPHVRNAAARALRRLEPQKSVDLFNRALEEGSPERRKHIGSAIAASGLASEAIDNLVSENREETYNSLSILFVMAKTGEVQPLIQAIEEHENEEVCRAVLKLLSLSGNSELGDAALQRRVMGVAASRQKADRHDEIPDYRLRIAEVEVKRALKKSDE